MNIEICFIVYVSNCR